MEQEAEPTSMGSGSSCCSPCREAACALPAAAPLLQMPQRQEGLAGILRPSESVLPDLGGLPDTALAVDTTVLQRGIASPAMHCFLPADADVRTTLGAPATALWRPALLGIALAKWKRVARLGRAPAGQHAVCETAPATPAALPPQALPVLEAPPQPALSYWKQAGLLATMAHAALPDSPPQSALEGLRFVLSTTGEACQPVAALTALSEGGLQCALTGNAFQLLLQHQDLSFLDTILRNAAVFARMQPHQKGQVVDLLSFRGLHQNFNGQPRHVRVSQAQYISVAAVISLFYFRVPYSFD